MRLGQLNADEPATYAPLTFGPDRPSLDGGVLLIEASGAAVVRKLSPGYSAAWVEKARQAVKDAAEGRYGELKFLVFDLAAEADTAQAPAEVARQLIVEIANLILRAPIVTVAYARGVIAGADLELALACSMLVSAPEARFSFAADPVVSVATYALLAQKIGFVRAERLMEREDILAPEQMRDLLLLKETAAGSEGLAEFLLRTSRRHNSAVGIYRSQRIATPLVSDAFGEFLPH